MKYALIVNGKTVLRGKKGSLSFLRKLATKRGGYVLSLDSKRAV